MKISRRTLLAGAAAGSIVLRAGSQPERTRLILLGTAGGATPKKARAAPAQVIVRGGTAYVIDCGNGVARQLTLAGVPLKSIRHIFLTHHHSDHNADYGTLLLLAWSSGLETRVDTWGPPPIRHITELFFQMSATDLEVRREDEAKPALPPLVRTHELTQGGTVTEEGSIKVRCAPVHHPLIPTAFAYRFDAPDRSIVISGDTSRSENLIGLARGADILVHEVLYTPAVDAIAGTGPDAARLKKHLLDSHTAIEEVGKIAADAGVKTLVLSHLVPAEAPPVPDETWLQGARSHFSGQVILGRDLMEI